MPDSQLVPFTPVPSVPYHGTHYTHFTRGLAGFPAVDIMAPGGTPIVAPEPGTIYAVSGHNPSEGVVGADITGLSEYLLGISGRKYYFTHLATTVDPSWHGDGYHTRKIRVGPGQQIGTIDPWPGDPGRSHLHFGVSGVSPDDSALIASTPETKQGLEAQLRATLSGGGFTGSKELGRIIHALPSGPDQLPGAGAVGKGLGSAAKKVPGAKQVEAAGNAIGSIGDAIKWIFDTRNILRVLEVFGGFILLLIGLYLLAKQMGAPTPGIPFKGGK